MAINKNGQWIQSGFNERLLPDGYTQLEYIESSGTQYIDTNFKPNQNSRIKINFYQNSYSSGFQIPFGTRVSNTYQFFIGGAHQNGRNDWYYRYGSILHDPNLTGNPDVDGYHEADLNGRIYKLDNYIYVFSPTTFQTNYNCYIFGVNAEGVFDTSLACSMKLYSFLLWDNEKLIRNYIPALRESDKEPGLYDLVNNVFYTNAGTGEFKYILKGIPSDYIRLEYVQSDGTQYIDTGIKGNAKHYYKMAWLKEGVTRQLMGYNGSSKEYWGLKSKNTGQLEVGGAVSYTPTIDITQQQEYRWEYNYDTAINNLYFNNELVITTTANPSVANTSAKFLNIYASTNTYICNVKIYSYIIKDWNDNILACYIPAKRNSDNKIGLFEVISQTFKLSGNNNQFIAGPVYTESANVKIYKETNALEANEFWEI